jgi:hypothetical protein
MRIEVENNRTPLNEFIASLEVLREPVELLREGKVVLASPRTRDAKAVPAKRSPLSAQDRQRSEALGWKALDQAHRHAKKSKLTQRRIDRLVDSAVAKVRKQNAASGR